MYASVKATYTRAIRDNAAFAWMGRVTSIWSQPDDTMTISALR